MSFGVGFAAGAILEQWEVSLFGNSVSSNGQPIC